MCELPTAAARNCHKISGLKQNKFILLRFWRSETPNGPYWVKAKVLAGLHPPGGSKGKPTSVAFLASRGHIHSLTCDPFLSLQSAPTSTSLLSHTCADPDLLSPSFTYKDCIGPTRIAKDHLSL